MMRLRFALCLLLLGCDVAPPAPGLAISPELARLLAAGVPLDEAYRGRFGQCDREDRFGAIALPARGDSGEVHGGCRQDPNRVDFLLRFPAGAVAFASKLAVDVNGSWLACNRPRPGDQCQTTLQLGPRRNIPLDADGIPWVVMPYDGPGGAGREFAARTGLRIGDFGVVVVGARVVPVILGNGGPFNKLGEGSLALHRAIGHEQCDGFTAQGFCARLAPWFGTLPAGAVTVLFPGSAVGGLTPGNIAEVIRQRGTALWEAFRARRGG